MPDPRDNDATGLEPAPHDPALGSVLKFYEQDFDRWEFTEAHPRITPFCELLTQLGGPDVA